MCIKRQSILLILYFYSYSSSYTYKTFVTCLNSILDDAYGPMWFLLPFRFFSLMWAREFLQVALIWILQDHICLVYYHVPSPGPFSPRCSTHFCWLDWDISRVRGIFQARSMAISHTWFYQHWESLLISKIVMLAPGSESSDAWNLTFLQVLLKICFWIHVKREELVIKINVSTYFLTVIKEHY